MYLFSNIFSDVISIFFPESIHTWQTYSDREEYSEGNEVSSSITSTMVIPPGFVEWNIQTDVPLGYTLGPIQISRYVCFVLAHQSILGLFWCDVLKFELSNSSPVCWAAVYENNSQSNVIFIYMFCMQIWHVREPQTIFCSITL